MKFPFPFYIADYPDNMKQYIAIAVKVIDNQGDPEWCLKKNKRQFCSNELHKMLILEYKRRIMINIYHFLQKKSLSKIKKSYMKKFTKANLSHIKSKKKLIRSILINLHKKPWKKLKQLELDANTSKTRKHPRAKRKYRTRRKR